jgi:hypothetical protein
MPEASDQPCGVVGVLEREERLAQLTTCQGCRLYEGQRVLVFHPDDLLFAVFRRRVEIEQGTLAKRPKAARQGTLLPDWVLDQMVVRRPREDGIVPL